MADVLVPLLGVAWIAWTAWYVVARRGSEAVLRRWAAAEGHHLVEAAPAKFNILDPLHVLHVSAVQRLWEVRLAEPDGSRRPLLLSVGHPWWGSRRDEVRVLRDRGVRADHVWRGTNGLPGPSA